MSAAKKLFDATAAEALVAAIAAAEHDTSGQIRVYIEDNCKKDVFRHAQALFIKYKMHHTAARNGVLIYLAVKDRKFAILGDQGIDKVVPADYWADTKTGMEGHFRQGQFLTGLTEAIASVGQKLKAYFPHQADGTNELPDDIVIR